MIKPIRPYTFLTALLTFLLLFHTLAYCEIVNYGNTKTRIVIIRENGSRISDSLYPGQSLPIPEDAKTIRVDTSLSDRGDEEIYLSVVLPDGTLHELRENGATLTL